MAIDGVRIMRSGRAGAMKSLAWAVFAGMLAAAGNCTAQSVPPFVVTAQTNLATYTTPALPPPPILQGPFGTITSNKFGDVFVGGDNSNTTYEFPASGGTPIVIYNSSSGGHAGAVAIDPNQNLIVTERYNDIIYMIPYFNGGYAPFTYSAPPAPPECTSAIPTSGAACTYDMDLIEYQNGIKGSVTGYYFQPIAIAFDLQGNSYIATNDDSNGGNNIFECTVACNYNNAKFTTNYATQLLHWSTYIDSIALDAAGNLYFVDGGANLYQVPAGTLNATTATTVSSTFSKAQGVAFDQSGNLYVSDNATGIYEIPLENGALNYADAYLLLPFTTTSVYGANAVNQTGITLDQHANIYATLGYSNLVKITVDNALLPATALGSTSAAAPLTVTFSRAGTLKATTVTAAGVTNAEFAVNTTGTGACVIGTAYVAGESCIVNVTFTPKLPGIRSAVLTLTDAAGDAVPVLLSGTGTGQAITVDPGTQVSIGTNLKTPQAVTVDAAGNVFVADAQANTVYEYPQGTGAGVSVGSGLKGPAGVAADAAGNLYISDTGNGRVVEVPNNGGTLSSASQSTLLTGLNAPGQLTVDSSGTLFIPETGSDDVVTYINRPALTSSPITTTPFSGLKSPSAVAVDASGNLYVADTGNDRVVEIADGNISGVVAGLSGPTGLALDGSASVIIADNGNGRIVRVPNIGGAMTPSAQATINTTIASPFAVQLDGLGNLYATDSTNSAAYSVSRTSGAIAFGKVNGGSSSVEVTSVLSSSGTTGLMLNKPLYPPLPSASPFSVTPAASDGCAGGTTLVGGSSCALDTLFAPDKKVHGPQSYAVNFSTGAQNVSAPSLQLSGNAVNLTAAKVLVKQTEPSSGNAHYGSPVTVAAKIVSATGTGPTPTGTVIFIVDGAGGKPLTLGPSGDATLVLSLNGGTHTVAAQYSGDEDYAPQASNAVDVVILPDSTRTSLGVTACVTNPLSAEPSNPSNTCDAVTMTAVVVPSVTGAPSGPVVFSSGGTVLGSATVVGSSKGSVTTYSAVLTTTTIPVGTYNVVATYSGDANYSPSTSSSTQLFITPPKFTLSASTTSITSSPGAPGGAIITVTSYSDFTGAVDFNCTGLPANAYCKFLPAVVALTTNNSGPLNVPALTTSLSIEVNQPPVITPTGIFWWSGLLLGLGLLGSARNRSARRRLQMLCVAALVLLGSMAGLSGCGSSSAAFTTPSGSSTVVVTATASPTGATNDKLNVSSSLTFDLTVK
jgi:sugar lactone lactonase YvrE